MPLAYTYADAYAAPQVTVDRETRAAADVAALGALPAEWVARLTVIRAYVIACIECAKAPDDLWSAKLSAYRKEWESALPQARAAQQQAAANSATGGGRGPTGPFIVALERA